MINLTSLKCIMVMLIAVQSLVPTNDAPWSVLIYADPCQDITEAVLKNIVEFVQGYESTEHPVYLQLRVFLEKNPNRSYAYRFLIQNRSLLFQEEIEMTEDYLIDITNAAQWAFKNTHHHKHAVIFSGHGSGILEPFFNDISGSLELEPDGAICMTCQKRSLTSKHNQHMLRSILINDVNGACVNNATMLNVMEAITTIIDKKIDILGLDMCMGASVEHAYQLAPYVHYVIGCQNCALADGFDFYPFAQQVQNSQNSASTVATSLVTTFQDYYERIAPEQHYTLSALDCSHAPELVNALNDTAQQLIILMDTYPQIHDAIMNARIHSFHACIVPMYTDLHQLLDLILQNVLPYISEFEALQLYGSILHTQKCLKKLIHANITGVNIDFVHGASIYFPYTHIDSSYQRTLFAQDCLWINFLEKMINA